MHIAKTIHSIIMLQDTMTDIASTILDEFSCKEPASCGVNDCYLDKMDIFVAVFKKDKQDFLSTKR